MYTIKHTRIIENYKVLLKAGLDKMMATFIARRLSARVILDVAISDTGVHIDLWDNSDFNEKTMVFKFVA